MFMCSHIPVSSYLYYTRVYAYNKYIKSETECVMCDTCNGYNALMILCHVYNCRRWRVNPNSTICIRCVSWSGAHTKCLRSGTDSVVAHSQ